MSNNIANLRKMKADVLKGDGVIGALRDSLPDGARDAFDDEVTKATHDVLKGL